MILASPAVLAAADISISADVRIGDAARQPSQATPSPQAPGRGKGPPPWAPAYGQRAKFAYRYYPEQQVYHRESDDAWIYLESGEWRVGARLPTGIRISAGNFVSLEMDTDSPYRFHEAVKAAYPVPPAAKKDEGDSAKSSGQAQSPGSQGRGRGRGRGR